MALVALIRLYTGFGLGVDDATATGIVGAVGALLVWCQTRSSCRRSLRRRGGPAAARRPSAGPTRCVHSPFRADRHRRLHCPLRRTETTSVYFALKPLAALIRTNLKIVFPRGHAAVAYVRMQSDVSLIVESPRYPVANDIGPHHEVVVDGPTRE